MADYGRTLAALEDLPTRGAIVSGDAACAYRCARRLLQPSGGLADVIEPEDGVEWPEDHYVSLDLREWCGLDVTTGDKRRLEAQINAALRDEPTIESASATVTLADRELSVFVDAVGAEGPFSFVLSVDDVSSATLKVL